MNENLFRFTLNNTIDGPLVISEPGGLAEATLKLERDKDYHSLVEFYDDVFTFYGRPSSKYNGGYDYVKNILRTQGPDADISYLNEFSQDGGDTYETLFDGLLKLDDMKEIANSEFYIIQCGIIRDDLWSRFWNQKGTSIDVQAPTDIYGEAREVLDTQLVNLTGQFIKQSYEGHGDPAATITYVIPAGEYGQIDFPQEILSEIFQKFVLSRVENAERPSEILAPKYGGDYLFNLELFFYSGSFIGSTAIDPGVKIQIQINEGAATDFTNTTETGGIDSWTKLSYAGTQALSPNDLVRIYLINTTGSSKTVNWYPQVIHDSFMEITGYTEFPDSTSEEILIHEATQSVLDRIIGQDDTLYSEYLGNVDTQRGSYTENGCFSYSSIAKGLHKKGFTFAEKPFSISFDQIWKGLDPMLCLGLGYDRILTSPERSVIVIAPRSHFYLNVPILNLSWVNNIEHSIDVEKIFKNIKIGYQKWESESISGLDEVQTKHEYAVPLKKIGESIELYSQFIGAALAQENTRRQSVEKSKDYRLDNDVFITHLYPNGSPAYVPYTADNIGSSEPSGTNIDFPESRYNLLFTVARNFERWKTFFNGGVQFNDAYLFQGGEGNVEAIIDDGGGDCGIGEVGENDNIAISNSYLFGIDVYEFEHPLSWTEYKLIRDNRRNSIGVSQTDESHLPFFILSLEWSPVVPKGKFKVVKGFPANGELNCVTADSTLVSADNAIITVDCDGGAPVASPIALSAELIYDLDSAPTWNVEYTGSPSAATFNEDLIGNDLWTSGLDSDNVTSVLATASKTGVTADGDGTVAFFKNGILQNSQSFNSGDDVSDVNYTYPSIVGGEELGVIINEAREDFIISAELTPFISTISYRIQYVGYPNITLTGSSSLSKTRTSPSSSFDVDTNVLKLTNGGIAEDAGVILWKRNGVTENTENFVLGDPVSYTYQFAAVNPGDVLLVEIFEG